jgi:hypothetical protein
MVAQYFVSWFPITLIYGMNAVPFPCRDFGELFRFVLMEMLAFSSREIALLGLRRLSQNFKLNACEVLASPIAAQSFGCIRT